MGNPLIEANPQLKKVRAEIEAILKRESIAGAFHLANSTHAEFWLQLPEWSAVQIDRDEDGGACVRVKSSSERDGQGHLPASMHMLLSMRDVVLNHAAFLVEICEGTVKAIEAEGIPIEHVPFGGEG